MPTNAIRQIQAVIHNILAIASRRLSFLICTTYIPAICKTDPRIIAIIKMNGLIVDPHFAPIPNPSSAAPRVDADCASFILLYAFICQ